MRRGIALALATSLALAAPAGVAVAGDRDVIREGSCSGSSDWNLKLSPENGRIEVEFEVGIVEDDLAGTDGFRARARNLSTDEVCVGSARF
jgi:hypothetical protein